ncbi:hypothetical protein TNCV_3538761 [Trichonephila clavipes]|nr:hypothetical protein TNCV_3538761 [Trichonephila clavipes]
MVTSPDYMVDALKLPNQAPRGSGESLHKCVAWWNTTPPLLAESGHFCSINSFKRCSCSHYRSECSVWQCGSKS